MALNTYAALKASALAFIDHAGVPGATNIIDDCVTLCEARINKNPDAAPVHDGDGGDADAGGRKRGIAGRLPGDEAGPGKLQPATPGGFSAGFDAGFEAGTNARSRTYEAPQLLTEAPQAGGSRLLSYAEPGWYEQAYPFNGSDEISSSTPLSGRLSAPRVLRI